MSQRVAYGALAIAVLVLVFMFDIEIARFSEYSLDNALGHLLAQGSLIPLLFLLVALVGALELGRLLRATAAQPHVGFACVMIAALLLCPWLSAAGWLGSFPAAVEGLYWELFVMMVAVVGAAILTILRPNPKGALRDFGATCIPIFYLGFLGSFGLQLRCGRDVSENNGAWLLLAVLLTTKASDIGAYFVGTAIGRHKLAPALSPGKSIEGTIGGLLASGLVATAFALASGRAGAVNLGLLSEHFVPGNYTAVVWAFLIGVVLSAAGQIGDLFESSFKRDAGTKDSGDVIPRYGGILDLIDSPVLALPVAWFLLTAVFNVV